MGKKNIENMRENLGIRAMSLIWCEFKLFFPFTECPRSPKRRRYPRTSNIGGLVLRQGTDQRAQEEAIASY